MEWVIPAILVIIALWATATHRRLVRLRQAAFDAWPRLEATLRARHDLLSYIAQIVLTHAPKEKKLVEAMTAARTAAMKTELSPNEAGMAERRLAVAVEHVTALERTYPDLQANLTFRRLHDQLTKRAEAIAEAREAFNMAALDFNAAAMGVPAIFVAKYMNLFMIEYFALNKEEVAAMRTARGAKFWA
ncbi:MAG: LemA family protein [Roseococcus sp.]